MALRAGATRSLIFDEVLDAVLVASDDRRIVDANSAACALFETSLTDLIGASIEQYVGPNSIDGLGTLTRASVDGSKRTLQYRAHPNVAPGTHAWVFRDATATLAVERRLFDAGARAERLHEMTSKLVEGAPVGEILGLVVRRGADHHGIRHAWMGLLDRKAEALVDIHHAGRDGDFPPLGSIPLSTAVPFAAAVREQRSIYVGTSEQCLRQWPAAADLCVENRLAIAVTPLIVRKVAIGAVMLSYDEPREFDEAERAFIQAIAQLCAAAIDRAAASHTLHDSERAQRFLADTGIALAQSLDEVETLRNIADLAVRSFADLCWVDLRDQASGELVRVTVAGPHQSKPAGRAPGSRATDKSVDDAHMTIAPQPDYPALRAIREGSPVLVRDFDEETWRRVISGDGRLASEGAPHSVMAVPLLARGENFGALTLCRNDASSPYDARDLALSTEVGRRASVAIENARLYATARRDRATAEEASRAKDQFLAVLGHELRNPLAPIATALRLMDLRAGNVCVSERATIERQVQHMTRLVDDLLDVSRITRGKVELRRRPVEIADVIAKAVEIASPALEQKQHRLDVDAPTTGLTVNGDAGRLAQVFANLLTNSAKYTPPYGDVYVRAMRDAKTVRVSVRDTGTGIAPDVLPHVFEVFVQGARRDAVRAGLGLGLAIVRSLTELHGGRVEALSDGLNLGSEFVVELPLFETATPEAARATPRDRPSLVETPLRVLVVDDNLDAAEMLAEWLGAIGHRVKVAADGPTALQLAAEFKPSVALLDIGLPVMDGYEVARRLRELPGCAATRLIALTGYGQESDHDRSHRAGFEDHLVKPVDLDTITQAVAAPLAR